jgi:hypothetical protein
MACFFIVHHHGGLNVGPKPQTKAPALILRSPSIRTSAPIVEENQVFILGKWFFERYDVGETDGVRTKLPAAPHG